MRALAVSMLILSGPAAALGQTPTDEVLEALRIGDVAELLHDEAVASAATLAEGLISDGQKPAWSDVVSRINAPHRIEGALADTFAETLPSEHATEIRAFFESPLGVRIVGLELSAREVLDNPGVEEAAAQRFEEARAANAPAALQVQAFIEANDLIDANVVGALNANAAFLEGMQGVGGPALRGIVPPGEIRREVWRQEPEIRESTERWVTAFVSLAYGPLPEEDFATYIDFSRSDAGQALNVALFAAFDAVFEQTSRETGAALAGLMTSEDL